MFDLCPKTGESCGVIFSLALFAKKNLIIQCILMNNKRLDFSRNASKKKRFDRLFGQQRIYTEPMLDDINGVIFLTGMPHFNRLCIQRKWLATMSFFAH